VSSAPRLPRASRAVVPPEKLVRYVLDPDHPRGCHKARVFSSALAIEQKDWRFLKQQLQAGVLHSPVRATRITPFGVLYDLVVEVDGLNGARAPVATVWIVEGSRPPRLVSAWVDIP